MTIMEFLEARIAQDESVARTDIAEVTGLSRTRIYEIRDGK